VEVKISLPQKKNIKKKTVKAKDEQSDEGSFPYPSRRGRKKNPKKGSNYRDYSNTEEYKVIFIKAERTLEKLIDFLT
jgi:hypothetical protein